MIKKYKIFLKDKNEQICAFKYYDNLEKKRYKNNLSLVLLLFKF